MSIDTIADIIRVHAAAQPDQPMVTTSADGASKSYAEVYARAGQVANALQAKGVGAGDRIAFLDKNSVEYFEVLFGGSLINAVNVAINWRLAAPEMAYIINDSDATVLVIHTDFNEQLEAMRADLTNVTTVVILGDESMVQGDDVAYEAFIGDQPTDDPGVVSSGDDVSLQLYTSGTTGRPKGAQLTNKNFSGLVKAADSWDMDNTSVSLVAMPLFHIGGSGWALYGMANGASSIVMREVDPMVVFELIQQYSISHMFLVPAALQFLLLLPTDEVDLSSMKLVVYGASPITEEVLVGSMQQFGCGFMQVYGLTETTGLVTHLPPEDHDPGGAKADLLRSAGKPVTGVALKIVDEDSGDSLAEGEVGEVWIQSPANMVGYWKLPEATAEALPGDGWFRSGDAGYMRGEYLFIHDRVKDMIVSGGENVYPAEIENVMMSHPSVADVGVIGVPSEKWGETAKALIVLAEGHELDEAALIAHCREQLAGFKCPSSVETIEALPRNPSGKILKRELRAPYWADSDRNV